MNKHSLFMLILFVFFAICVIILYQFRKGSIKDNEKCEECNIEGFISNYIF